MTVLAITGTGTSVGKTVTTAALACHALQAGIDVAVIKPVQTGTAEGGDDLGTVRRLSGVKNVVGLASYPQPMAPVAAAELAGSTLPSREEMLELIRGVDRPGRLTLVEGAGGLLVELAADRVTLRDLALDLHAEVLVVAGAELGTLNHTALTLEAIAAPGLSCAGLVIGSWPVHPNGVETSNRAVLSRLAPLRAELPYGAGSLDAGGFATMSDAAFDSGWVSSLVG